MAWQKTVTVNGFDFLFFGDWQDGVLLQADAPLDDENYIEALKRALSLQSIVSDFMCLDEMRDYWYRGSGTYRQHVNVIHTLEVAWRYSAQQELTQPDWLQEFVADLMRGTPLIAPSPKSERKLKPGFIYLLQQVDGSYYKIGRAKDPKNRAKTFGVQLPFDVEYTCLIKTEDMITLETELHTRFADKRVNGEWFALAAEDVEYIKGLAK